MRLPSIRHNRQSSDSLVSLAANKLAPPQWDTPSWLRWIALLALYGLLFTTLRTFAALWGTYDLFSLWFPAAGLRFALLWRKGPQIAPAAALAELAVGLATRTVPLNGNPVLSMVGVMGPCYAYGLVIALVRARAARAGDDVNGALPFTTACIIAPFIACLAALPWAWPAALRDGVVDGRELTSGLLVFSLGDLLGVLLVAPPLLWIARQGRWREALQAARRLRQQPWMENLIVLAAAWGLVALIDHFGNGVVLAPVVLAACWVGLRGGRTAAWFVTLMTGLFVFPFTAEVVNPQVRFNLHLVIACIAAGGYLAGSYAESEGRAAQEISRRNRLLFHADRLKTVRSMSLAVIHEISQPLTTIALEARALSRASTDRQLGAEELRGMAELIARKADDLSEMIGRLRKFGSAVSEERSSVRAGDLLENVRSIVADEASRAGLSIVLQPGGEVWLSVSELELKQALLNLVRNALAAAPNGGKIELGWRRDKADVLLFVENEVDVGRHCAGMGIGLLIVRSIVQAHGGHLELDKPGPQRHRSTIHLPLAAPLV